MFTHTGIIIHLSGPTDMVFVKICEIGSKMISRRYCMELDDIKLPWAWKWIHEILRHRSTNIISIVVVLIIIITTITIAAATSFLPLKPFAILLKFWFFVYRGIRCPKISQSQVKGPRSAWNQWNPLISWPFTLPVKYDHVPWPCRAICYMLNNQRLCPIPAQDY